MLAPKNQWPPDYDLMMRKRAQLLIRLKTVPGMLKGAKAHYADNPADFIEDWVDTFDPRNAGTGKPTRMPFFLFQRQREFIEFLHSCVKSETSGLIEKSRDMGATWLCCGYSVWSFLFVPGSNIGWGSRKADSVDEIGNMSSIFEKMRYIMRTVPVEFWPDNFGEDNMSYMRIYADNGSSITGESGDDIGRGGRTQMYFKDESAHYEHPESIEASLGDNTRVQIDISSVNGLGNVFHRKREAGVEWNGGAVVVGNTNVFVMNWTDHPEKTQTWYDMRRANSEREGLLHIFKQEVDRDYAASVEGVVIPSEWIVSAIDAHDKLGIKISDLDDEYAGLDVADGGSDRNALVRRKGVIANDTNIWGERDTGVTARKAVEMLSVARSEPLPRNRRRPVIVEYDSIGVGSGVKAEVNRLSDDKLMPKHIKFHSWNAGGKVVNPDVRVENVDDAEVPTNDEFFTNLKAQAWWSVRRRFEKTHRAVTEGVKFNHDELVSLPSTLPNLRTLQKELSQVTMKKGTRLKLLINKTPDGTSSPNLADAFVMCYFPVDNAGYDSSMGWL